MARATKSNNWGRINGFLSDIVGGTVIVENPDGCVYPDEMGTYSTDKRKKKYGLQESGIYGTGNDVPVDTVNWPKK